ncbi:hypothetical protein ACFL6O_04245 [candidate division KSB1 bacterium]
MKLPEIALTGIILCLVIFCSNKHNIKNDYLHQQEPPVLTLSAKNISLHGGTDGSIELNTSGGTEPYSYTWSNVETSKNINGLSPGSYKVTVADSENDTVIDSISLTQPYKLLRITSTETGDYDPHWSPDGKFIVFFSNRTGQNEIFIMSSDGGTARQLTFQGGYHPCWSPDGSTIAFTSSMGGGADDIWTVPAAGGEPIRITTDPNRDENLDWSYDGNRIIFDSNRTGSWNLYSVSALGGDVRQITDHSSNDNLPSCSPDGSTIAFISQRSGSYELWTVPAQGGTARRMTNGAGFVGYSDWSPDGNQIVFMSGQSGNPDIWIIPKDGGTPVQLTTHTAPDGYPNWSPDGKKIAFFSDRDGPGDIWILDIESKHK